jgi:hypothetical protein
MIGGVMDYNLTDGSKSIEDLLGLVAPLEECLLGQGPAPESQEPKRQARGVRPLLFQPTGDVLANGEFALEVFPITLDVPQVGVAGDLGTEEQLEEQLDAGHLGRATDSPCISEEYITLALTGQ